MKAAIVTFPGTNRERDMRLALKRATGRDPAMLFHRDALPAGLDLVVLPGGFSYGDYLRCGAMAAQSPIMKEVRAFAQKGGHVLGVCNGFQILSEMGPAAGRAAAQRLAALPLDGLPHAGGTRGHGLHSRWQKGAVFRSPMAHGDGNYFADDATLDRLEGEGLVAFRYTDAHGEATEAATLNGSARNIAGIFSENLRICGLMPHPEDLVDPLMGGTDGLPMFESLAESLVGA